MNDYLFTYSSHLVVLNSLQNLETTLENTGESAAKDQNQQSESDYSVASK